jgi:hypothetical protein
MVFPVMAIYIVFICLQKILKTYCQTVKLKVHKCDNFLGYDFEFTTLL